MGIKEKIKSIVRIFYFLSDWWNGRPELGGLRSGKWPKLRNEFFKANPLCALCGNRATQIHHIYPVWKFPEKELLWENLISLCSHCHLEFAHLGSYKSFNKDIKIDALIWQDKRTKRP